MWTHLAMEFSRGQGKKVWESWKPGDQVQHIGTKEWATIEKIVPQTDDTCEMILKRTDPKRYDHRDDKAHWASYHIRDHKPKET